MFRLHETGHRDTSTSDVAPARSWLVSGPLALTTVTVIGVIYVITSARMESFGSDTSTYFGLAESLRTAHRYWFDFEPHRAYPPGYPLLLAGMMSLVGDDFSALVRLSVPIYFVGLLATYWLLRLQRGAIIAATVVVLCALCGDAYFWATVGLHSDIPYFTVSMLALLFLIVGERATRRWPRLLSRALAPALLAYLVLLRSIGVTLVGGVMLWMCLPLLRTRGRDVHESLRRAARWWPTVLVPAAALIAWSAWTKSQVSVRNTGDFMDSYAQQILKQDPHQLASPRVSLTDIPVRAFRIGELRAANAVRMVLNTPPVYLRWYSPIVLVFMSVVICGFVSVFREGPSVVETYLIAYVVLLLLYPFDEGSRYLLPLLPFLIFYGSTGITAAAALVRRLVGDRGGWMSALGSDRLRAAALVFLFVAIAAGGFVRIALLARVNLRPDTAAFTNAATVQAAEWLRTNTTPTDVLMDDQWAILHRLTNRKTLRLPLMVDADSIANRIAAERVAYVVILDEKPGEYFNPSAMRRFGAVREHHPNWFTPVHVFSQGTIYRVERDEISAAGKAADATMTAAPVRLDARPANMP